MEPPHVTLSTAIHGDGRMWKGVFPTITDDHLRRHMNEAAGYDHTCYTEPRLRVWKRIVEQEAHKRGVTL